MPEDKSILALETSTERCSVCLSLNGSSHMMQGDGEPNGHSRQLVPMIENLLRRQDMHLANVGIIAFGKGPGSFTGLRIGAGIAQGLGYALGIPVIGVSSLAALAASQGVGDACLLPLLDARMGQVYYGGFRKLPDGRLERLLNDGVAEPESIRLPQNENWLALGPGWLRYRERIIAGPRCPVAGLEEALWPLADSVAQLARIEILHDQQWDASRALPTYVRDEVAKKPGEKLSK